MTMANAQRQENPTDSQRASKRIIGPVSGPLRIAGTFAVLAGLIWPIQAAALAWAISGWVSGDMGRTGPAALIFVLGGVLRAALDHRAGRSLRDTETGSKNGSRPPVKPSKYGALTDSKASSNSWS